MNQTIGNYSELKRNSHMKKRQGDLNILLSKQCQLEKSMHDTILTIWSLGKSETIKDSETKISAHPWLGLRESV